MSMLKVTSSDIYKEIEFNYSRSSGPGGQHVNKVNTKVGLRFNVADSELLNEDQKVRLLQKLENKLTKEGVLVLSVQESRSQLVNKELAIKKLDSIFEEVFKQKIKRKPTKPTKASKQRRLTSKKQVSEKKANRKKL